LNHIVGSLADVETASAGEDGVAEDPIVVGFKGNDFGSFPVGAVKEVCLDQGIGPVLVIGVEFSRTPHSEDFPPVARRVGNVLEIVATDGVGVASHNGIAQQGMQVVLSLEVTFLEQIVVALEIDPVVVVIKGFGIEVDDGAVPHGSVKRFEMDDGKPFRIDATLREVQSVDHDVGGVDLKERGAGQEGLSRAFRPNFQGAGLGAATVNFHLRIGPIAFG